MNASRHAPLLIVDDDEDIRDTMQALFESEGYSVVRVDAIVTARTYLCGATEPHIVL